MVNFNCASLNVMMCKGFGFSSDQMNQGAVMTLLKQLLPLAALLLLSIVPTETEVVTSVKDCNEFFLKKTPPNITRILEGGKMLNQSRYKLICQTLNNTTTFVTLYDTQNKIPFFSAAKFNGSTSGPRPQIPWMIEPQVYIKYLQYLLVMCYNCYVLLHNNCCDAAFKLK